MTQVKFRRVAGEACKASRWPISLKGRVAKPINRPLPAPVNTPVDTAVNTPVDPTKSLSESWDRNAGNWTRAVRGHCIASRAAGTDRAILDALKEKAPARLLDVGCGEGWLVRRIAKDLPCTAVGIDGSADMVASARQADPDNAYHQVTYAALCAGQDSVAGPFDAVVFNFALLQEDVTGPLIGAKNLLAPGGAIFIQTLHPRSPALDGPYLDGWRTETFSGFTEEDWVPMPWFFRTLESWHAAMKQAGLTVIEEREPKSDGSEAPLSLLMICETP